MKKIKNIFKDFTAGVGLGYDPEEEIDDEFATETLDLAVENSKYSSNNKEEVLSSFSYNNTEAKNSNTDTQEECQTIFVNPKNFSECKKIADYIKNNKVVTLNLENISPKEAQRILDFLSGAMSIKEAKWIPISKNVFTSLPKNINFFYDGKNDLKQNTFLDIDFE